MNDGSSTYQDRIRLKVCGLTQLNQIDELISMNTDFLGFIFYEKSPRYVLNHLNLKDISKINSERKVGVFVNESVAQIIEISKKGKLNFIQLHGDEDEHFILELRKNLNPEIKIIKVIRIGSGRADAGNDVQQILNRQPATIDYLLFDTDSKAFGGTGTRFDWNVLNTIEIPLPYFLSGGISEENIHQINILRQKPMAIDINSKFEIEAGIKDIDKVKKLMNLM